MELFYNESLFANEDLVTFGPKESHHKKGNAEKSRKMIMSLMAKGWNG